MGESWTEWDWSNIGRAFRAERGDRNRQEIAAATGVSVDTIGNLERGRQPLGRFPEKALPLASYYGWTPDSLELVGNGGEPRKTTVLAAGPGPRTVTVDGKHRALALIYGDPQIPAEERAYYASLIDEYAVIPAEPEEPTSPDGVTETGNASDTG